MPYGLCNAAVTLQHLMQSCLVGQVNEYLAVCEGDGGSD